SYARFVVMTLIRSSFASSRIDGRASPSLSSPEIILPFICEHICSYMGVPAELLMIISMAITLYSVYIHYTQYAQPVKGVRQKIFRPGAPGRRDSSQGFRDVVGELAGGLERAAYDVVALFPGSHEHTHRRAYRH